MSSCCVPNVPSKNTDLATLLLVLSEKAADTFRESGITKEKLFYLPRGVDVERFKPGTLRRSFARFFPAR